jgi:hypothetical protein
MNPPASQAARRFLRFPQLSDTMPIRAEDLCVNLPLARRQAPQHRTNGERGALEYQPGSSLLPLPALDTSAPAPGPAPVDHRDAKIDRRLADTPPAPLQLSERILHDLLSRHRVRARQPGKTRQPVMRRGAEDLDVAPGTSPGPPVSAEPGSGVTVSLRMSLKAHQAAIRFPHQPSRSQRQEHGRIAPADTAMPGVSWPS